MVLLEFWKCCQKYFIRSLWTKAAANGGAVSVRLVFSCVVLYLIVLSILLYLYCIVFYCIICYCIVLSIEYEIRAGHRVGEEN